MMRLLTLILALAVLAGCNETSVSGSARVGILSSQGTR